MGNKLSSVVNNTENPTNVVDQPISDEGGRTRSIVSKDIVLIDSVIAEGQKEDALALVHADSDSDYSGYDSDSDDEDDDDDDDEELLERLRILEDAQKLKQLAVAFLHPEAPVETDSTACARCYFNRPSAPKQESAEEAEERAMALADAAALRKLAVDYMHPELGVVTSDATATARCYFDRTSAPEQESAEDAEERRLILEDAQKLRDAARQYLHPELSVVTSDAAATARCYFNRPSAPEQESVEEAEERALALANAAALKKLAVDYMHPELAVVSSDPTATARCYFDRASAPEQEIVEDAEERALALADAAALKRLAVDYMHPEFGVLTSDATATARCHFDRASAPEQESVEDAEERALALADAAALRRLADDYMHPELGVVSSDPTATARCYFDRPSAPHREVTSKSSSAVPKKTTESVIKKSVTQTVPAPVVKTVESAMNANTSGIVISVSAVQLYGLDEDDCDPSF